MEWYYLYYYYIFQTAAEWQLVFWITAFVYGCGVIFFALTVSGDRQPWNDVDGDSRNTETIESGDEPARSISMSPNSEAKLTDVRKLSSPKGGNDGGEKASPQKDEKDQTKAASPQSPKKETPAQEENKGDNQEDEKVEEEGIKKAGEDEDEKPTTTTNNEEATEEEKKE